MACPAHDISQRPLQNAMRLVKVAIQLDSGNRHKVTGTTRLQVTAHLDMCTASSKKRNA